MATPSFVVALAAFATIALSLAYLAWGTTRVAWLRDLPRREPGERAPRVSIVVPALNEARWIEPALRSLAALEYPDLEIVAIDDRSTDATPTILARLATELRGLRVVTVRELPPGWLGKNHANWLGARAASGELLLFTDADVVMAPDALDRAVQRAEHAGLDHLTAAPDVRLPGRVLAQFALYFALLVSLMLRPWAATNPRSRAHIGVGAFNLVRRDRYFAAGGHEAIRLRPDDDVKLAKVLKRAGGRAEFVVGAGLLEVEWYGSWREVRDGLMKNLYAGLDYRTWIVPAGIVAHLAVLTMPLLALAFTSGATWWLNLGSCTLLLLAGLGASRALGTAWWGGATLPLFAVFGAYLLARSTWLAHRNDGIDWRGTHYPLAELRRNVV